MPDADTFVGNELVCPGLSLGPTCKSERYISARLVFTTAIQIQLPSLPGTLPPRSDTRARNIVKEAHLRPFIYGPFIVQERPPSSSLIDFDFVGDI